MRALVLLASVLLAGCIGAPSPLAPSLGGSVGLPHKGTLTGGVALPEKGEGFVRYRKDGVKWGAPRLVSAIQASARGVHQTFPRTPPLVVGDLSQSGGGETERHRSHRSGRDVDLLYYVTTPDGVPVRSPGFVKLGADGLGSFKDRYLRFDVPRNWALMKELILSDNQVQWLFVARHLEAMLVEHAMAIGEEPTLVHYASLAMQQPSDSAAHDDHVHVRLACSPAEAVAGCEGGPRWPYLPPLPTLAATDEELLAAILLDP